MSYFPLHLPIGGALRRSCFVVLFALCTQVTPAPARADTTPNQAFATMSASPICVGWTWSHLFAPIERNLGNQTNMIRFGVIAVFSAMYIIWWRK
ncbi:MAG TPA: hypothetical protein VGP68_04720 [Gemmataceae bacterium]|jgi:hypothetical protein|nr:hypothetical protein [Gemmataceae bacterium]